MPDCPHCHRNIEIFGQKEGAKHLGISSNTLIQWRKKQWVPDPWYVEGNRPFWIKEMLAEAQRTAGMRAGSGRTVHTVAARMAGMTSEERKQFIQGFLEQVNQEVETIEALETA